MRLDRYNLLIILLSLFLIIVRIASIYPSVVITGRAMPNSSCMLKCNIRGYYIGN